MSKPQEEFNRILSKVEKALEDEELTISLGVLMNMLVLKSMIKFDNLSEAYYTVDRLKYIYFDELRKLMNEKK